MITLKKLVTLAIVASVSVLSIGQFAAAEVSNVNPKVRKENQS